MTDTGPTWLSRQGYEQTRDELSRLLLAYRSGRHPDHDGTATEEHREGVERRIRQLQELLLTAEVGAPPPDDGVAEPGMVLTVRHAVDQDTDTFLLATRGTPVDEVMGVCSPQSPLGRALLGARANETRSYVLPDGSTSTVTLLRAEPFRE